MKTIVKVVFTKDKTTVSSTATYSNEHLEEMGIGAEVAFPFHSKQYN
jgi:hypothetical protein